MQEEHWSRPHIDALLNTHELPPTPISTTKAGRASSCSRMPGSVMRSLLRRSFGRVVAVGVMNRVFFGRGVILVAGPDSSRPWGGLPGGCPLSLGGEDVVAGHPSALVPERFGGQVRADAETDIHAEASLLGPVDVLQIEGQGEFVGYEGASRAVGSGDCGVADGAFVAGTAMMPRPKL